MPRWSICAFVLLLLTPAVALGQAGKVSGTVSDAETGEPLPGVNVVIQGTTLGAATDADGYYVILNVPPGTHDVTASFIGYVQQVVQGVEVNIDLTTNLDIAMRGETVGLDEVLVTAEEPVVQRDLSASRVDVSSEDIENLPVSDVSEVVGLQAGVQGLSIRGGGSDEVGFVVDGLSLGSKRNNQPFTEISYTAVQQIQMQSGGFNAEYGDMRSGVVSVVTKDGPRDRYIADVLMRYSAPAAKHFGPSPADAESYWMKPYMDDAVAWEGTESGAWDEYTQRQYPEFRGFNALSEELLSDENPNNDMTPQQVRELFEWEHRRDLTIDAPDYVVDGTIGGPVPGISRYLGDLRFLASYRQTQDQYIIPLSRDGYEGQTAQLKLTSDLGRGMKLTLNGLVGRQSGVRGGDLNRPMYPGTTMRQEDRNGTSQYYRLSAFVHDSESVIFGDGAISTSDFTHNLVGAKFTHSLSARTFYETSVQYQNSTYDTVPLPERSPEVLRTFGSYQADEAPLGFGYEPRNSIMGMRMGGHASTFRDTSRVGQWEARFDITSQVQRHNQVKAGVSLSLVQEDVTYGHDDALKDPADIYVTWNERPVYAAAYVQDKLEFQGMIANVGVRLDYFSANTDWWALESVFPDAFLGKYVEEMDEMLGREPVEAQLSVSPRIGVSFPVTAASKLYFNYGHFRQTWGGENLYMVQRQVMDSRVRAIANPRAGLPKTIAYELGYEQSLFDKYLVRLAGYYKDVSNQSRWVNFVSRDGLVNYSTNLSKNYEDIRGFEISLFKNAGKWVRGFVNYTYMVYTDGQFGFGQYNQNRVEQRRYERESRDHYQYKPLPQPYARISVDFLTPPDFGPAMGGFRPLGDWRINVLGSWQAGNYFTWTGDAQVPGVQNNLQWKDYRMVDMRLSKNFAVGGTEALAFVDVYNVLNLKNFNQGSFYGPNDFKYYMRSLRLPEEIAETIPDYEGEFGDDQPGDLDKEYIDPPNGNSFRALFPRDFYFGLRLSF